MVRRVGRLMGYYR